MVPVILVSIELRCVVSGCCGGVLVVFKGQNLSDVVLVSLLFDLNRFLDCFFDYFLE